MYTLYEYLYKQHEIEVDILFIFFSIHLHVGECLVDGHFEEHSKWGSNNIDGLIKCCFFLCSKIEITSQLNVSVV